MAAQIEIGKTYFFQSVTHNYIGKVSAISPAWIETSECAYVAVTGPYKDFMAGRPADVERVANGTLIPVGALVVVMPYAHRVPG